jgi:hypothetical protein
MDEKVRICLKNEERLLLLLVVLVLELESESESMELVVGVDAR